MAQVSYDLLLQNIEQLRAYARLYPTQAEAWATLGMTLQAMDLRVHSGGALQVEALDAFERALSLSSPLPRLQPLHDFTGPVPSLQPSEFTFASESVSEDDLRVNVLYCKGILELMIGRPAAAIESQIRVLQICSERKTRANALHHIAQSLRVSSHLLEALHACILAVNMGQLMSFNLLVEIHIELAESNNTQAYTPLDREGWRQLADVMEAALETHLHQARDEDEDDSKPPTSLYFALFKALQRLCVCTEVCECDRAWDYLNKGNAANVREHSYVYRREQSQTQLNQIRDVFVPGFWVEGIGHPSTVPVFIIGMMRSGSTLVEQILDAHTRVHGMGEDSVFNSRLPEIRNKIVAAISSPNGYDELSQVVQRYGDIVVKEMLRKAPRPDSTSSKRTRPKWIVDKMLFNFRNVGFIHLLFPNAVILHTVRDPMDCLFSCYKLKFDDAGLQWSGNMDDIVDEYMIYIEMMHHWRTALPGRVVEVLYEDIVYDTEYMMRFLIQTVGADWEDQILQFHTTQRVVHTHSLAQVRQRITPRGVGGWRKYIKYLSPMVDKLRPRLQEAKERGMLPFPDRVNWDLNITFEYGPRGSSGVVVQPNTSVGIESQVVDATQDL